MKRYRTPLAVFGAIVALVVAAVISQATISSAQPPAATDQGITHLDSVVDLPSGAWTNTPLAVTLPWPGTYELDADVRGRLSGSPSFNSYISARLWNDTAGAVVPQSERIVNQIIDRNPQDASTGSNHTAPISELIHVSAPTTIRLQGLRVNAEGTASIAQIYSDGVGRTSLRFARVGD